MLARHAWPGELVVAGDRSLLEARSRQLGLAVDLIDVDEKPHRAGSLCVAHQALADSVTTGKLNHANSESVLGLIEMAVDGCLAGRYDAMVTAPIQKSVIIEAGFSNFVGHTEFLAERCGAAMPVMLLACDSLRVALVTTHLPLSAVPAAITPSRLEKVIGVLATDLRERFGIARPRVGVLGLNPHAGEDGHLGTEELDTITPVIEAMNSSDLELKGPLPADTAFLPSVLEELDAVLAMYHDQGLPVLKHYGFDRAVNVTLGLPVVRTSVDHGTALSLAGTGDIDSGSMLAATRLAFELGGNQRLSR